LSTRTGERTSYVCYRTVFRRGNSGGSRTSRPSCQWDKLREERVLPKMSRGLRHNVGQALREVQGGTW